MPDPFVIIGLLDTAFSLGCQIYAFFSALKDAPQEIRYYANELDTFNKVLEEVKNCRAHFETMRIGIPRSFGDNQKNQQQNLSLSSLRKLGTSSSWVFDSDERIRSTQRLGRLRVALELALTSTTGRQHIFVREELGHARDDINEVKDSQQDIIYLLQNLFYQVSSTGQERVKSLNIRVDQAKMKTQVRLDDLSEKLESDFVSLRLDDEAVVRESTEEMTRGGILDTEDSAVRTSPDDDTSKFTSIQQVSDNQLGALMDGNPLSFSILTSSTKAPKSASMSRHRETIQIAFEEFQSRISPGIFKQLQDATKGGQTYGILHHDIMDQMMMLIDKQKQKQKQQKVNGVLKRFLSSTSRMGNILEDFIASQPEYAAVVWGSLQVVLQATSRLSDPFLSMVEMLEEVGETIRYCDRESKLYPNPGVEALMVKLYVGILEFIQQSLQLVKKPTFKRLASDRQIYGSDREQLQTLINKIRQTSVSVMKEVEYLHRVELREAHTRIKDIEKDQQRMIMAMEDQKKIMLSLKEERNIMTMMNDQQLILQAVQSLQMKLSMLTPAASIVESVTNDRECNDIPSKSP